MYWSIKLIKYFFVNAKLLLINHRQDQYDLDKQSRVATNAQSGVDAIEDFVREHVS